MDLNLKGRRVLITGASQGIGEGLARGFAAEGCKLYLVARSEEKLNRLAAELHATHRSHVRTLAADLTCPGAVAAVMNFSGGTDILINNAGDIPGGSLLDVDEARWRAGWELKVFGYVNLTRAMYAAMKIRGRGVVINNIGSSGEKHDADYIAGTTGNAALMALTCALGARSLEHGIRVVGVNPGPVDTPRIERMLRARAEREFGDADRYGEFLADLPLGRCATVEEVTDLCLFLASDRSAYTTGAVVRLDGGAACRR